MPQKLKIAILSLLCIPCVVQAQDSTETKVEYLLNKAAELGNASNRAYDYLEEAVELARTESPEELGVALYNLGIYYDTRSDFENALFFLDSAEVTCRSLGQDEWLTKTTNSKGVVFLRQGRYEAALSNFLETIALADSQKDIETKIVALRNAGHVAFYQNSLDDAMEYYQRATEIARTQPNKATVAACYSDQALVYQYWGELEKALAMNDQAAKNYIEEGGQSSLVLANIYQNMGVISKSLDRVDEAEALYEQSLEIFKSVNNEEGLAQTFVNQGELYLYIGNFEKASVKMNEALTISKRIGSNEGVKYSHMGLAETFEKWGRADSALYHYKIYRTTEDSLMSDRMSAELSEMRLKYEKAENEKTIALLEQETAEKQNVIQSKNVALRQTWIVFIGAFLVLTLAAILWTYYKRNQSLKRKKARLERFSDEMIRWQEDERKKVAGELHDGIGQSLVMIKNTLQRFEPAGDPQEEVVSKIENAVADTIQEVRQISYSLRPFYLDLLGLEGAVNELLVDLRKTTVIEVKGDVSDLNDKLEKEQEIHMFRIFQESIQNIVKHSIATEVEISVNSTRDKLEVCIADNGVGFDSKVEFNEMKGFGLRGMKERVNLLRGKLHVDSARGKGTRLFISIPY